MKYIKAKTILGDYLTAIKEISYKANLAEDFEIKNRNLVSMNERLRDELKVSQQSEAHEMSLRLAYESKTKEKLMICPTCNGEGGFQTSPEEGCECPQCGGPGVVTQEDPKKEEKKVKKPLPF